MKKLLKILVLAAFLGALGLPPFRSIDAAKLLPVKTVVVTKSGDSYTVDVGAGVKALGRSLTEALRRLREEVTGVLFLPTAEQVVLTEPAEEAAEAVAEEPGFRPAMGIYRTPDADPDPAALGEYLASHPSNTTILNVRAALAAGETPRIPRIRAVQGGFLVAE